MKQFMWEWFDKGIKMRLAWHYDYAAGGKYLKTQVHWFEYHYPKPDKAQMDQPIPELKITEKTIETGMALHDDVLINPYAANELALVWKKDLFNKVKEQNISPALFYRLECGVVKCITEVWYGNKTTIPPNFTITHANDYTSFKVKDKVEWSSVGWESYTQETLYSPYANAEKHVLSETSKSLPGVDQEADYPCDDKYNWDIHKQSKFPMRGKVWKIIQHLNDNHPQWSRERIADWLDELQDERGYNFDFQIELEENE